MKSASYIVSLVALGASAFAEAGTLHCAPYGSGGYCEYNGRVREAYVNKFDQVIVYFDESFDVSVPSQAGFTVSNASAAMLTISDNPDFAKMFYASVLSAQARGATVRIQMMSVIHGYLMADRIWVVE